MEVLAALIGAGIVAASPFVPVLRPVAKAAVKSGMAVSEAVVGVASAVGQQVNEVVARDKEGAETAPADEGEVVEQEAGKGSLAATAETAAKVSVAVTDKAKEAVVSAGKYWSDLVAEARESLDETAEEVAPEAASEAAPEAPPQAVVEIQQEPVDESPAEPPPAPASDDLAKIRGIGPKTATLLQEAGITTFAQVAAADEEKLRQVLNNGGTRYRSINPSEWPEEAQKLVEAA